MLRNVSCQLNYVFFSDLTKAVTSGKQQGLNETATRPVQIPTIQPLINREQQTRAADRRAVLLPPSSFTLPCRSKGAPLQSSLPEGVDVRASNSTRPASTPRTSLDSQKHAASSPSSATSSSSRGSEEEEERDESTIGEYGEEEEGDRVGKKRDEGECEGEKTAEDTVKSELPGQLRDEENLRGRIAAMKKTLQEFQDLKATYR